jgi:hypothetical protein
MHSKILVVCVALAVAAQACCCCTMLGGPQPPYTVSPSDDTIERLEERLDSVETDANGNFSFTVTEEEMTALARQSLDKMQDPPPISEPQVLFRNGRVELYMIIHLNDTFDLPGMMAFTIDVHDGDMDVTIEEVIVGPLPMPESVTQAMTEVLNDSLKEGLSDEGGEAMITDVQIGDREMVIYGQMPR